MEYHIDRESGWAFTDRALSDSSPGDAGLTERVGATETVAS
ncbi:hypothetical protein NJ7G_0479 [Natrinema sp. J7-2]|nr:hypothetical protein NJ7G_0479 [Natrinema sp. J7-2]